MVNVLAKVTSATGSATLAPRDTSTSRNASFATVIPRELCLESATSQMVNEWQEVVVRRWGKKSWVGKWWMMDGIGMGDGG